ncbi:MAG: archaellin/type IV pilin N-terminal domain-containing protein, partial [Halobacteriales archaeon]
MRERLYVDQRNDAPHPTARWSQLGRPGTAGASHLPTWGREPENPTMKLRTKLGGESNDDRAVSPIIGVVLMV